MKKRIILITAILAAAVMVTVCAASSANDTYAELYDDAAALLFDEQNVSLSVSADFELDGNWFKTAEGTWKQDGDKSFRKLHLRSPKKDGSIRENGYTIVTEGLDLFLMEEYTPGVYRTGTTNNRSSILRKTAATQQLVSLGRVMASRADLVLGEGALTRPADGEVRIALDENAPALVNAALNQAAMFAAKRYFSVDYDQLLPGPAYTSIYDYGTLSQGILSCMRGLSVRKADITLKTDGENRLQSAEGSIGLYLETSDDGVHQLDVTFRAEVSDRGSTMLKKFDPADYGAELAKDSWDALGNREGEEIRPGTSEALEDQMMMDAMKIWENTGFNMVASTSVSCKWDGYCNVVSIEGGNDGITKKAWFSDDGQFYNIEAEPADWMDNMEEGEEYDLETGLDPETDGKAQAFFREFMENIRFEKADQVKDLQVQWTFEKNGSLYALYEDKSDPDVTGISFVIRIRPEMRIEAFYCASNG